MENEADRIGMAWRGRLPEDHARRLVLVGLGALLVLVGGCSRQLPEGAPPVILVSLDTVRADVVAEGRRDGSLPQLARFAAGAVDFTRAATTMPFTLPAHMSMMTGLHQAEHGVTSKTSVLPATAPTLAEQLSGAGYDTIGLYTSEWLKGEFGFARGFDHYAQVPHGPTYADRVIRTAFELVDARTAPERPLFLFLHFYDAHSDFVNQSRTKLPYYSAPELRVPLPPGVETRFCTTDDECATAYLLAADREHRELSADDLAMLRELYTLGVRGLDADLASLFDGLRERGLYDRALIVVTSDHGEEFREHGRLLHSQVYEPLVAVPLFVKLPGGLDAGEKVQGLVTLADLPAMVETVVRRATSRESHCLAAAELAPQRAADKPVFMEDKLVRDRWAVRSGDFKLILTRSTGAVELYDLAADPDEQFDLSTDRPEVVSAMRSSLEPALAAMHAHRRELRMGEAAAPSPVLDEDEAGRLRALGYVE